MNKPSISGYIPFEEVWKLISDFLDEKTIVVSLSRVHVEEKVSLLNHVEGAGYLLVSRRSGVQGTAKYYIENYEAFPLVGHVIGVDASGAVYVEHQNTLVPWRFILDPEKKAPPRWQADQSRTMSLPGPPTHYAQDASISASGSKLLRATGEGLTREVTLTNLDGTKPAVTKVPSNRYHSFDRRSDHLSICDGVCDGDLQFTSAIEYRAGRPTPYVKIKNAKTGEDHAPITLPNQHELNYIVGMYWMANGSLAVHALDIAAKVRVYVFAIGLVVSNPTRTRIEAEFRQRRRMHPKRTGMNHNKDEKKPASSESAAAAVEELLDLDDMTEEEANMWYVYFGREWFLRADVPLQAVSVFPIERVLWVNQSGNACFVSTQETAEFPYAIVLGEDEKAVAQRYPFSYTPGSNEPGLLDGVLVKQTGDLFELPSFSDKKASSSARVSYEDLKTYCTQGEDESMNSEVHATFDPAGKYLSVRGSGGAFVVDCETKEKILGIAGVFMAVFAERNEDLVLLTARFVQKTSKTGFVLLEERSEKSGFSAVTKRWRTPPHSASNLDTLHASTFLLDGKEFFAYVLGTRAGWKVYAHEWVDTYTESNAVLDEKDDTGAWATRGLDKVKCIGEFSAAIAYPILFGSVAATGKEIGIVYSAPVKASGAADLRLASAGYEWVAMSLIIGRTNTGMKRRTQKEDEDAATAGKRKRDGDDKQNDADGQGSEKGQLPYEEFSASQPSSLAIVAWDKLVSFIRDREVAHQGEVAYYPPDVKTDELPPLPHAEFGQCAKWIEFKDAGWASDTLKPILSHTANILRVQFRGKDNVFGAGRDEKDVKLPAVGENAVIDGFWSEDSNSLAFFDATSGRLVLFSSLKDGDVSAAPELKREDGITSQTPFQCVAYNRDRFYAFGINSSKDECYVCSAEYSFLSGIVFDINSLAEYHADTFNFPSAVIFDCLPASFGDAKERVVFFDLKAQGGGPSFLIITVALKSTSPNEPFVDHATVFVNFIEGDTPYAINYGKLSPFVSLRAPATNRDVLGFSTSGPVIASIDCKFDLLGKKRWYMTAFTCDEKGDDKKEAVLRVRFRVRLPGIGPYSLFRNGGAVLGDRADFVTVRCNLLAAVSASRSDEGGSQQFQRSLADIPPLRETPEETWSKSLTVFAAFHVIHSPRLQVAHLLEVRPINDTAFVRLSGRFNSPTSTGGEFNVLYSDDVKTAEGTIPRFSTLIYTRKEEEPEEWDGNIDDDDPGFWTRGRDYISSSWFEPESLSDDDAATVAPPMLEDEKGTATAAAAAAPPVLSAAGLAPVPSVTAHRPPVPLSAYSDTVLDIRPPKRPKTESETDSDGDVQIVERPTKPRKTDSETDSDGDSDVVYRPPPSAVPPPAATVPSDKDEKVPVRAAAPNIDSKHKETPGQPTIGLSRVDSNLRNEKESERTARNIPVLSSSQTESGPPPNASPLRKPKPAAVERVPSDKDEKVPLRVPPLRKTKAAVTTHAQFVALSGRSKASVQFEDEDQFEDMPPRQKEAVVSAADEDMYVPPTPPSRPVAAVAVVSAAAEVPAMAQDEDSTWADEEVDNDGDVFMPLGKRLNIKRYGPIKVAAASLRTGTNVSSKSEPSFAEYSRWRALVTQRGMFVAHRPSPTETVLIDSYTQENQPRRVSKRMFSSQPTVVEDDIFTLSRTASGDDLEVHRIGVVYAARVLPRTWPLLIREKDLRAAFEKVRSARLNSPLPTRPKGILGVAWVHPIALHVDRTRTEICIEVRDPKPLLRDAKSLLFFIRIGASGVESVSLFDRGYNEEQTAAATPEATAAFAGYEVSGARVSEVSGARVFLNYTVDRKGTRPGLFRVLGTTSTLDAHTQKFIPRSSFTIAVQTPVADLKQEKVEEENLRVSIPILGAKRDVFQIDAHLIVESFSEETSSKGSTQLFFVSTNRGVASEAASATASASKPPTSKTELFAIYPHEDFGAPYVAGTEGSGVVFVARWKHKPDPSLWLDKIYPLKQNLPKTGARRKKKTSTGVSENKLSLRPALTLVDEKGSAHGETSFSVSAELPRTYGMDRCLYTTWGVAQENLDVVIPDGVDVPGNELVTFFLYIWRKTDEHQPCQFRLGHARVSLNDLNSKSVTTLRVVNLRGAEQAELTLTRSGRNTLRLGRETTTLLSTIPTVYSSFSEYDRSAGLQPSGPVAQDFRRMRVKYHTGVDVPVWMTCMIKDQDPLQSVSDAFLENALWHTTRWCGFKDEQAWAASCSDWKHLSTDPSSLDVLAQVCAFYAWQCPYLFDQTWNRQKRKYKSFDQFSRLCEKPDMKTTGGDCEDFSGDIMRVKASICARTPSKYKAGSPMRALVEMANFFCAFTVDATIYNGPRLLTPPHADKPQQLNLHMFVQLIPWGKLRALIANGKSPQSTPVAPDDVCDLTRSWPILSVDGTELSYGDFSVKRTAQDQFQRDIAKIEKCGPASDAKATHRAWNMTRTQTTAECYERDQFYRLVLCLYSPELYERCGYQHSWLPCVRKSSTGGMTYGVDAFRWLWFEPSARDTGVALVPLPAAVYSDRVLLAALQENAPMLTDITLEQPLERRAEEYVMPVPQINGQVFRLFVRKGDWTPKRDALVRASISDHGKYELVGPPVTVRIMDEMDVLMYQLRKKP